jgi:hypothetical protein
MKPKTGGTYFEAGANDGIFHTNTLWLELNKQWTGLLVEPPWVEPIQILTSKRWPKKGKPRT